MAPDAEGCAGKARIVEWNGREVEAWIQAKLRDRDLIVAPDVARAAERAVAALQMAYLVPHTAVPRSR